jgi:hypothetical protein
MQAEALHHLEHQVQDLSNTIAQLRRSHDDISKQAQVCALTMSLVYPCTSQAGYHVWTAGCTVSWHT